MLVRIHTKNSQKGDWRRTKAIKLKNKTYKKNLTATVNLRHGTTIFSNL